jgi:signal transduction histidine kinase/CheY-like chemotaxis protein
VLVLALGVALLLSSILQRIISHPLKAVAAIAGEVSTRHDYSLRVERTTGDELGMLVDAFNGMLEQIEVSERERTQLLASERHASRLKDEFLMTLSHELRTPLNAIVGWTRILRTKVVAPDQVDDALERIERNAHAQARLIEDLLDVSRLTTGKLILDRVDVDLVALANQAIETVVPLAEARRIRIERAFDTPTARLAGDPHRLQQVVWNLLSNAIKFSASDSRVVVRIRSTGGWCELRVQDEGIGIDPDLLPFIFEPFRQGDASITRSYGGLGLGLSIVRRIVDLHGGKIAVESAGFGLGAVFTVSLPAAVALPAPPSLRPGRGRAPQPTDLPGVSIVVVDDDPDARAILAALLLSAGAHVRQAAGGREALALIREAMPDVLVSDIAMPDLDGYALLRELRKEHGRSKPSATIAVTAQATPTDRELALAAGFNRHLPKPFEPSVLVDLIQSALADLRP